jgi:hypothetical protein
VLLAAEQAKLPDAIVTRMREGLATLEAEPSAFGAHTDRQQALTSLARVAVALGMIAMAAWYMTRRKHTRG